MSVLLCACHQGLFFPKLTRLALLRFNASLLCASRAAFATLAAPPIGESFFIKSLKLPIWAGSFYFGTHSLFIPRKVLGNKTGELLPRRLVGAFTCPTLAGPPTLPPS